METRSALTLDVGGLINNNDHDHGHDFDDLDDDYDLYGVDEPLFLYVYF